MAADLIVTLGLLPLLWPWMGRLLRPTFSMDDLRVCLRFGLPRLPHGLAQQALDAGNKFLLSRYVSLSGLGVYQIGATLGQSLKFFLSAFETGWAPFYYEASHRADAKVTFSKITTYGIAILALLVAGITAVAADLVLLLTNRTYEGAALIVPLIALGIACQGVYLLTSIGLNLSSQTKSYPVSTFAAAAVGLGTGVILMPLYGAKGAAIAFLLSYVTLAAVAGYFAHRHYPMTYEKGGSPGCSPRRQSQRRWRSRFRHCRPSPVSSRAGRRPSWSSARCYGSPDSCGRPNAPFWRGSLRERRTRGADAGAGGADGPGSRDTRSSVSDGAPADSRRVPRVRHERSSGL